ncbi:MAG TPA: ABC transporter substrate-binding protein [Alphaproteobacteria bacterium]|jgi:branched-chain amino acid transport system substrate-binding protein|nr:ABC transporter substrate-binding protein [Alphaproteobacteria bacterium]
MLKRLITAAAAAALMSGLAAGTSRADDLPLGYLAAKTGPFVSLSRTNSIAVEMAVDEINAKGGIKGKKLKLVTFDTAGKPEQAVVGVRKLAEDDKVLAIVGPFSSGEARVAFAAGDRAGIATMSMASSAPKLAEPFKFAFRNTSDEGYMFSKVMATIVKKNLPHKTAAVAYATDDTISKVMGTAVLPGVMKKAGVEVVKEVDFKLAAFDFSPQVSQIKATPVDLVGVGSPPDQAIKLAQEMRRQGVAARLVAGSTVADPDLPAKVGKDGDGFMIPTTFFEGITPAAKKWAEEFSKRAKAAGLERTNASQFDAASYDIVLFYAWAMEQTGITGDAGKLADERAAIRDKLRTMKNFPALEGPISFGSNGDALKPVYILEMKDGKWTLVDSHPAG